MVAPLQTLSPGIAEKDINVSIPVIGLFSQLTLNLMSTFHNVMGTIWLIVEACSWIDGVDFATGDELGVDFAVKKNAEVKGALIKSTLTSEMMRTFFAEHLH